MQPSLKRILPLLAGPLLFVLVTYFDPFGLSAKQALVLAIAVWMIIWWVTEALPMPVVALMPLILFPLLGVATTKAVAAPYANEVIFLFMGGFMIGLAIEKWNLHKRIALSIVNLTGTSGNRIVLGFILSTGLISMWLSNTATTMMMYPIAMSVISVMEENGKTRGNLNNLSICLLLAIAYASNFGGLATIIGTPPNVQFKAFLEKNQGYDFSFADWMKLCLPLSLVLLLSLYFVMVKWLYPNNIHSDVAAKEHVASELHKLGKLSTPEARVLVVFATTALLWITRDIINNQQQWIRLDDTMIAVMGAVMLFILPSGNTKSHALLEWSDTKNMAWGILLLFGGGISMADQLEKAGLIQMLGEWMGGVGTGGFLLVFFVALVSIFISEVMSNVAQVIVFAPVIAAMAAGMHIDLLPVGMAMTLGASCAGMLPMGTPPNAIVFASGRLKLKHMTTTGFVMNMISAVLISLFCWYLLPVFVKAIH
jgi:solute carrier family 13 (sodium-dependent dicarboxylate transporter), member 2/3/5